MKRLFLVTLLAVQFVLAGTSGKIAGKAVDAATGQPLVAVNVQIVGTTYGAATDLDGNYFIINVPVGTYTIKASMIGYAPKTISNVKVMLDMTTTIDFRMDATDVQMGEVIVVATRPPIQPDVTSTKHTIDEETINALPVTDFREIVGMQAGVSGSHFRGGRFNESLFLVDGIAIKSAVNSYSGTTTGGFAMDIPQLSVSEIQVSTGGFEAEYGNAQSGIVNTITKSSMKFGAKLRVRTSDFPWSKIEYQPNTYAKGQPDWRNYEAFINSPGFTIGDAKISLTGTADISFQTKSFLAHEDFYNESYQAKISYNSPGTRITLNGLKTWSRNNSFYHRYSKYGPLSDGYQVDRYQQLTTISGVQYLQQYIFVSDPQNYTTAKVPDSARYAATGAWYKNVQNFYQSGMQNHISWPVTNSHNISLSLSQTIDNRSFLDVKLSLYTSWFNEVVRNADDRLKTGNLGADLNWLYNGTAAGYKDRQFEGGYWYYTGDEGWFLNQISRTAAMRIDYSNQINPSNLLKSGLEFNWNKGDVEKVTFESVLARRFDIWEQDLYDFAFYVQDKIEVRDGFILNAGLRFDYFNPNGFSPSVLYPADPAELADPARRASLTAADKIEPRWQVSPRIGISHPITERDKIHFYYGHFFQRPDLRFLYENMKLDFRFTTNVDLGNPRLKPEKTVSYEVGWEHLFSDFLRLDITGYFKDITNQIAAADYDLPGSTEPFQAYVNLDYANVRGLEITLEAVGARAIGGMMNYSYSFANGRSSSVYRSNGQIVPRRLDPLDWDLRHRINASVFLRSTGAIEELIGNAELDLVLLVRSGYPYTRNTRDVFPLFALRNDGRLSWSKNVDMKFRKSFSVSTIDLSLLVEVRNLFNWRNVSYIAGGREGIAKYEQNGDPSGPYFDPQTMTRPRVYRLGFELQF
jgi:outer membrane receptor protein involved in Fe transport